MKRVASGLVRWLLGLGVALLVMCAVFVGVARELVYQVDDFRPEILGFINEQTGLHLECSALAGSWAGLAPRLFLRNVVVRQKASTSAALQVDSIRLEILLLRSLLSFSPRVRLIIDGAVGEAHYDTDHLVLSGFDVPGDAAPKPAQATAGNQLVQLDTLLKQPRIELTNSHLTLTGLMPQAVNLQVHQLRLEAGARRRYMLGDITASGPSAIHFTLKGHVNGSLFSPGSLDGGVYVQLDQGDLFPWIPPAQRSFANAELNSLHGGASAWLNFTAGKLREVVTRFDFSDVVLLGHNEVKPPRIKSLQGTARWATLNVGDWRLDLSGLRMQTTSFLWLPSVVSLSSQQEDNGQTRYHLKLGDVDLEPWINYYLAIQPADSKVYKLLKKLRPAGKLQHVALELMVADRQIKDYRFMLRVNEFQNRPWNFIPGFYDLDLQVWGTREMTLFKVDDTYLEMNYPRMFRDLIVANHLRGVVSLKQQDDGLLLQSGVIEINSRDAQSATQFSLTLPSDKTQSPFLQLQATLRNGDGEQTSQYLPAGVLPEPLLEWLDQAIVDGHLLRGDILVHGPVYHDSVEPHNVLLGFTAENATLQFLPDWKEPLRGLLGDVVIDRGAVDAHIIAGEYYGQTIEQGTVTLPHLEEGKPHILSVRASGRGQAQQGFAILTGSPLRNYLGSFIDDFAVNGAITTDFAIDVPLDHEHRDQLSTTTQVALDSGRFAMPAQNIDIENLNAQVSFDLHKGLSASKLSGNFLGGRINGAISTRSTKQGKSLNIKFNGNSTIAALQQWRPLSVLQLVDGALPYGGQLVIPLSPTDPGTVPNLQVDSSLEGVQVHLPAPFGKAARAKRAFSMNMALGAEPQSLNIHYANQANLLFLLGADGIQRGAVQLGPGRAIMPNTDVLSVSGVIPRFDDREWADVLTRLESAAPVPAVTPATTAIPTPTPNEAAAANAEAAVAPGASVASFDNPLLRMLDDSSVRVEDLTLAGIPLGQTDLRLLREAKHWTLWLNNDLARGKLELPTYLLGATADYRQQSLPVQIQLDRLQIPADEEDEGDKQDTWQPANLSPKLLPPVDFSLAEFKVGANNFGRWDIRLRPSGRGLDITQLKAQVDGVTLTGKGQWLEAAAGQRQTRLQGKLEADNAADAIRAIGGTPPLSSKSAEVSGDLTWPGAPFEFALNRSSGDLSLHLKNGVFYNVSSNAAGKLWGALNFETFMRRLQLDFDDLKESDMVYDEISGKIKLDRGLLNLSRFRLNSPAVKMNASGKVDLEHRSLAVDLDVAVPVTRNLLLPAAVIGGVPGAATAYVVEKMFGEQFDKLTTIKYAVTGSFDDPVVKVRDSFSIIPKQVGEAVMRNEKSGAEPTPAPVPKADPSQ